MNPTEADAWEELARHSKQLPALSELVLDEQRTANLRHTIAGCLFDFSKQHVDANTLRILDRLAAECGLVDRIDALFSGDEVNRSEGRPALHSALRGGAADPTSGKEIAAVRRRMSELSDAVRAGQWRGYTGKPITDIVHIGIGGSHLGPELVVRALDDHKTTHLNVVFLANIDANDLHKALAGKNPETTLFIVASKSFGTLETKVNAMSARSWFIERTNAPQHIDQHFIGITTNLQAASEFGLNPDNLLPMWDWVGGRYSLWSAVGLPIQLALGTDGFNNLLAGACEVDQHLASTPFLSNVPALSALLATWNYNFLGAGSLAVLSYDERLTLLPEYLQQLEMESNGKSVDVDGNAVNYHTMPILWGGTGTRGQHAYHQLLHQGTQAFAADFIVVREDERGLKEHHDWLLANALGQSKAMAEGFSAEDEPYRDVAGNHPTTTVVLDELGPRQLGALLAVYEHKVFCQGSIWNINSFDQWGVELGKNLAIPIYEQLASNGHASDLEHRNDPATQGLIDYLRSD